MKNVERINSLKLFFDWKFMLVIGAKPKYSKIQKLLSPNGGAWGGGGGGMYNYKMAFPSEKNQTYYAHDKRSIVSHHNFLKTQ